MHHRHRAACLFQTSFASRRWSTSDSDTWTLTYLMQPEASCCVKSWLLLQTAHSSGTTRPDPTRHTPRPVMSNTDQASERHTFKSLLGTWEWIRNSLHSLNYIIIIIIISVWMCVISPLSAVTTPPDSSCKQQSIFIWVAGLYTEWKTRDNHPPMCRIVVEGPHRQAATRLSKVYSFVR